MAIVILNAGLGIVQERRAEEAIAALRQLAAPEAHVIRDGSRQVVPARESGAWRPGAFRSRQLRSRGCPPFGSH